MAGLLIREIPEDLHRKIRGLATSSGRSMAAEVVILLRDALDDGAGPPTIEQLDAIRVRGRKKLTHGLVDKARKEGRP
jgi:plasmid stability protein